MEGERIDDIRAYMSTMNAYKPPDPGPHIPGTPTETYINFYANGHERRTPYIQELIRYENDGVEGFIEFNGYYYVYDGTEDEYTKQTFRYADDCLPQRMLMDVIVQEKEPYHRYRNTSWFRPVSHDQYEVEFYKRTKIKCTDQISEIEDEEGEPMKVCFFPTDEQQLYFRVIKKNS